ncbi:calcitonin receptor [Arvicola amphibius]|uniref:calcitonin receptor n=1 Tax=Arvicola amphibius TaxID=1047088 RepID=UPI0018E3BA3C|nr:calcitonin receptor [Arvicola amphibius]
MPLEKPSVPLPKQTKVERGNFRKPKLRFHLLNRFTLLLLLLLSPTPAVQAPVNLSEPSPTDEAFLYTIGRKKLLQAQYSCYDRLQELPPYEGEGLYCNRTWDGWLCWDDTPAGATVYQHCPDYFPDFDVTEKASKYCDENGEWFRHPDSNRTWSNYTLCNAFTSEKLHNAYVLYYLALVGHSLSIAALITSLGIYLFFKSLRSQRVTVHKNMFLTYILNSIIIIIHLLEVVPNGDLVRRDPMHIFHHNTHMWTMQWELSPLLPQSAERKMDSNNSEVISCKVLHFFHQYMMACNYFWMLCEGIYLHTLIVVAVFAEEQRLCWYYLLGWGFPVIPTTIHAVTRALYYNDNCWLSVETHLLYIVHGPVMVALVVNFFFLLNIVRVLVTKLRQTHQAEAYMYLKAVKATMVLVPLLGIQFVVFPWRPSNKILGKIYDYVMHTLIHFQGFFVATIYCFFNHEVQVAVKRQWAKLKIRWSHRWGRRRRRRNNNRVVAAPRVTAFAEPGGLPLYICHQEPRNPPVNNNRARAQEGTEMIPMNAIPRDPSAIIEEEDSTA